MRSVLVCVLRQFAALRAMVTMGAAPIKAIHHHHHYIYIHIYIYTAAVCSLLGQARRALLARRAYLSQLLEGDGSIRVRDDGFSPLIIT